MKDEDIVCIPYEILKTLHRKHYFDKFAELCQISKNQYEAWQKLETTRQVYHIPLMYDNFDSFKNSYYYHINKRLGIKYL